jgi:hypothetical protein
MWIVIFEKITIVNQGHKPLEMLDILLSQINIRSVATLKATYSGWQLFQQTRRTP